MHYRAVIFDLDGTLLNTLEDLADAVNHVLRERHFPLRSLEEIRTFVGNGVGLLMRRALPEGTEEAVFSGCLRDFKDYYAAHMEEKTAPYEGILPLLDRLKADGCRLAVVSNKFDGAVQGLCRRYFGERLDAAAGETEARRKKPAPDTVWYVAELLGVRPEECVYVGDSDVDIETAAASRMPCISVSWGFRTRQQLTEAGAARIAATPEELYRLLSL